MWCPKCNSLESPKNYRRCINWFCTNLHGAISICCQCYLSLSSLVLTIYLLYLEYLVILKKITIQQIDSHHYSTCHRILPMLSLLQHHAKHTTPFRTWKETASIILKKELMCRKNIMKKTYYNVQINIQTSNYSLLN